MLGALEKTVWALTILFILAAGGYVGFGGLPSTIPPIVTSSKQIQEKDLKLTQQARADFDEQVQGSDEKEGETKPRDTRPRPKTIYEVDPALQQRLKNFGDCMQEARYASSEITKDGTLKIFDIQEGSLLSKVGLEENDEIERVLGKKLDFTDKLGLHNVWEQCNDKLSRGIPVVIELRRNGQVRQLVVSPGL